MVLDRSRWGIGLGALLLLTLLAYSPLRSADFAHEDNPAAPLPWAPALRASDIRVARSLVTLTGNLTDQSPRSLHALNLGLHLASGMLLAAMLPATPTGLFATGLFLLHPINSEAVSYIAARTDLLLGLFVLVTIGAATVGGAIGAIGVPLGLVACWGAKESGLAAVALLGWWMLATGRLSLPVLCSAIFVALLAGPTLYLFFQPLPAANVWRFLAVQSAAIWRLHGLLMPYGLTVDHDWARVPTPLGLTAFLFLVAVPVTAFHHRKDWPRTSFAVIWSALALAPRFLVPTPHYVVEHHLYVPLLGLWLTPSLETS